MKVQRYWNGVAVSQEDRDKAAQEVFNTLARSSKPSDETSVLTGDMLIHGDKFTNSDGRAVITITDTIIRRRTTYLPNGNYSYEE